MAKPRKKAQRAQKRKKPNRKAPQAPEAKDANQVHRVKMRVIGIGGGGGTIVSEISSRVSKVDFYAANTDAQALRGTSSKVKKFAFGSSLTKGLGTGMDPALGKEAAKAEKDRIRKLVEGQDVCILIATLGGGTGTGAASVFAEAAQEAKCLTIGVFTLPFKFEGERRAQIASTALDELRPLVNAYIVIPNEQISSLIDRKTSLRDSLSAVNRRLADSMEGLMETIFLPGLINIDFADLKSILEGKGRLAFLNSASASGSTKAMDASRLVLQNPLLEYTIDGAERILYTIASDRFVKMKEVAEISNAIAAQNAKAKIIFGISQHPRLKDKIQVMLFAVGVGAKPQKKEQEKAVVAKQAKKKTQKRKKQEGPKQKKLLKVRKPKKVKLLHLEPAGEAASGTSFVKTERIRRNALDIRRAQDQEMQEFEAREKEWEMPAFLRKRFGSS